MSDGKNPDFVRTFFLLSGLACIVSLPRTAEAQFTYSITNNTITLTGYTNTPPDDFVIPDSISVNGTNLPVTTIADWAFAYFYNVTSITIGANVTTIGSHSFQQAYGLLYLSGHQYPPTSFLLARLILATRNGRTMPIASIASVHRDTFMSEKPL